MAKALGRYKCNDAMGLRSMRVRDQDPDQEEGGKLVCRIVEDARGNMHVMDAGRLATRPPLEGWRPRNPPP